MDWFLIVLFFRLELVTIASELRTKIGNLKTSTDEQTEQMKAKAIYDTKKYLSVTDYSKGNQKLILCF